MSLVRGTGKPRVLLWQFGDLAIFTLAGSPGRVSHRYLRIRPSVQEYWHEAATLHLSSVPRHRYVETTPPGEMISRSYTMTIGLLWLLLAARLDEYRQHAVWLSSEGHFSILVVNCDPISLVYLGLRSSFSKGRSHSQPYLTRRRWH